MSKWIYVISLVFLISFLWSCEEDESEEETQEEVIPEKELTGLDCVHPGLLNLVSSLGNKHGDRKEIILEFFQYKGQDYLDVVVGYYNCGDVLIDGYFMTDNRVIVRNRDSCSLELVNVCALDKGKFEPKYPPPHEPVHYSYIIHNEDDYEEIYHQFKAIDGRVVRVNGQLDTLSYRLPWDFVIGSPPRLTSLTDEDSVDVEIYEVVETQPEFPGGLNNMYSYLGDEIVYPQKAQDLNIQGKVYVQFVVEKDGSITDVNVIKGAHYLLDTEAVRVISNMPNWSPGKQRGKEVRVRYTIPINFTIN